MLTVCARCRHWCAQALAIVRAPILAYTGSSVFRKDSMEARAGKATPALAVKAAAPHLQAGMQAGEAMRAIANSCIAQLAANRQGVQACDGESVHQMRVALRRWHAACRLLRSLREVPAPLAAGVDWLAGVLGPARDWDVLAGATLVRLAGQAPDAAVGTALATLQERSTVQARRCQDAAAEAAGSARFGELVKAMGEWIDSLPSGPSAAAAFARAALQHDRKRLAKRARHLAGLDAPARHRLRIAAKKARYDGEFFLSLHDSKAQRRRLRRLAGLQDALGALNDGTVARTLLAELPELDTDPVLAKGAGFVLGSLGAGQAAGVKKAARLWRKLK